MEHDVRRRRAAIVAVVAALSLIAAACGSDDDGGSTAATGGDSTGGNTVAVTVQEFAVLPATDSAPAGDVTFAVTNTGPEDTHEFVVFRTDLAPDALPTASDGSVDEEGEEREHDAPCSVERSAASRQDGGTRPGSDQKPMMIAAFGRSVSNEIVSMPTRKRVRPPAAPNSPPTPTR